MAYSTTRLATTTIALPACTCRHQRSNSSLPSVDYGNGDDASAVATTSAVSLEQLDELVQLQRQTTLESTNVMVKKKKRKKRAAATNGHSSTIPSSSKARKTTTKARVGPTRSHDDTSSHANRLTNGHATFDNVDDGFGANNDQQYFDAAPPTSQAAPGAGDDYKRCEAIDRWERACNEIVVGGIKGKVSRQWCIVHEREELVVRQEFYRCADDVNDIGNDLGLPTVVDMHQIDDLDELEDMESTVQDYIALCDKTLKTSAYHSLHFGAAGNLGAYSPVPLDQVTQRLTYARELMNGRPTPMFFDKALLTEQNELTILCAPVAIMDVSHLLIVESEDADWLTTLPDPADVPCSDTPSSPLRAPNPPALQTEADEPDPVIALERVERATLLETLSLTGSHASFITNSRRSLERVRIIECLFRRLISKDRDLLVKAYRSNHDHVLRALEDPECCDLAALKRIHEGLRRTSALQLKDAIMDAFRAIEWEESGAGETEPGDEGMGLQLLGGWRYAYPLKRSMTRTEWNHLYDLCGCPDCAVRCCIKFQDLAMIRRLTVVPNGPEPPPFESWGDAGETDAGRIMRALDVVKCSESGVDTGDAETRKVGGSLIGNKGKGLWVERVERNWMFLKISVTHFKPLAIMNALAEEHVIIVRSRVTPSHPLPSYPLPPPTHLWFSRHRSSPSKPSLKHAAWQSDPDEFGPGNVDPTKIFNVLDSLDSPEKAQGMTPFDEVYEVLVLDGHGHDGREGTGRTAVDHSPRPFVSFEASIGQCISRACGIRDVGHALECGMFVSFRQDELSWTWGFKESDDDVMSDGEIERKRTLGWRAFFEDKNALNGLRTMSRVIEREARLIAERKQAEAVKANAAVAAQDVNKDSHMLQDDNAHSTVNGASSNGRLLDDDLAFRLSRSLFR
ncbi:hypothetical protein OIO90_003827 [Microbotryomycetes sp. JL221]|nr:hypothetical protein OIO90_003827 [Microbotryomycetes sp. JL221]